MVNYSVSSAHLDLIFKSLGDATRRDILERLQDCELTVTEIAKKYAVSLPAISRHLHVLEKAKLIQRRRQGKEQVIRLHTATFQTTAQYLETYRQYWESNFDALDKFLQQKEQT